MKRGQVMIRGTLPDGTEGPIDVMDLDEESFRAFFIEQLTTVTRFGTRKRPEELPGEDIRIRHRDAPRGAAQPVDTTETSTTGNLSPTTPDVTH
jgi:hypothetical protein